MNKINLKDQNPISPILQEEFRTLYSNLEFSGADNHIICVTSSYPNEGKSYVAYNLARIIAEGNKKVLLLDADMRKSTLYRRVGFDKNMRGLTHILSKKCDPSDALYMTDDNNFYIMPTGVLTSNPTILLRQEVFPELLKSLSKVMDYIIVDTPPIGLVTDASIIANLCDASVLIIASGEESRKSARESILKLKNANDNFLGVILNKNEEKNKRGYGKYGKYGNYGEYGVTNTDVKENE